MHEQSFKELIRPVIYSAMLNLLRSRQEDDTEQTLNLISIDLCHISQNKIILP